MIPVSGSGSWTKSTITTPTTFAAPGRAVADHADAAAALKFVLWPTLGFRVSAVRTRTLLRGLRQQSG